MLMSAMDWTVIEYGHALDVSQNVLSIVDFNVLWPAVN